MNPVERPRLGTRLPHVLAALYGLAIVYASLEPFQPWLPPPANTPFFLFDDSTRWSRNDALLNVLAYIPFGLFVALLRRGLTPGKRIAQSVAIGAAMSFAMESLQMYIPPRVASPFDLIANVLGATLGGCIAVGLARSALTRESIYRARMRLFLPGPLGDIGLSLLLLWLVVQTNPGLPLFSMTFENESAPMLASVVTSTRAASALHDSADQVVHAAGTAFQVLGVGLFAALLMRGRRRTGTIVAALIVAALLLKSIAALYMLKPAMWQLWVKPETLLGVITGAIALRLALMFARPVQVAACAIALLSSLGAPVLAPESLAARAPTAMFDWHFGQLMNYNGLTRAALLVWPVLTAVWLFALAGRPAWGKPVEPAEREPA